MPIDYTIAPIPTVYGGIRYRSRLEARWAAFFDLVHWDYIYEPADLGKWSPDFLLLPGPARGLVEVKPITSFDVETAARMATAARKANFDGALMLLGTAPFRAPDDPDRFVIGWYGGSEWREWKFATPKRANIPRIWAKASNAVQWQPPA